MDQITLSVPDISCAHCKSSIEGAVSKLDGVGRVDVSIDDRTVAIEFVDAVDLVGVTAAIEEQGYEVDDRD